MSFSDRLKEARKKAGLTQLQIGEKLGITAQSYSQYETGKRSPKRETLEKIAEALNLGYGYAKDGEPYFYEFTDVKSDDKNSHQQIIGRKIKECRIGKMTQKELGRYIGKSTSTIKRYENGLVEVPTETLKQIASVLDISMTYFNDDPISSTAKQIYENNRKYDIFEEFIKICYRMKICTPQEDADTFLELTKDGKTFYAEHDELFEAYQMAINIFPSIVETTIQRKDDTIHSEFMGKIRNLEELAKIEYTNSEYKDIYKKSEKIIKNSRLSEQAFLNIDIDLERFLDLLRENLQQKDTE